MWVVTDWWQEGASGACRWADNECGEQFQMSLVSRNLNKLHCLVTIMGDSKKQAGGNESFISYVARDNTQAVRNVAIFLCYTIAKSNE